MISMRPLNHNFPGRMNTVDDLKVVSDCIELFSVNNLDCPDCHQRTLIWLDSDESFTDALCSCCGTRIEVKGIRLQGKWSGATLNTCRKGFSIRLGSKKGFHSVFSRGHAHLFIIGYTYTMEKGYDIEIDKSAQGIVDQTFQFGLLLRKNIVQELCQQEGVIDDNDSERSTSSKYSNSSNSDLLQSNMGNVPSIEPASRVPIQFIKRGKKMDMIVNKKGFPLFEPFEPPRPSRTTLKRRREIQTDYDDAMVLVKASEQFQTESNRIRKRKRKIQRKWNKKMKCKGKNVS